MPSTSLSTNKKGAFLTSFTSSQSWHLMSRLINISGMRRTELQNEILELDTERVIEILAAELQERCTPPQIRETATVRLLIEHDKRSTSIWMKFNRSEINISHHGPTSSMAIKIDLCDLAASLFGPPDQKPLTPLEIQWHYAMPNQLHSFLNSSPHYPGQAPENSETWHALNSLTCALLTDNTDLKDLSTNITQTNG